MTLLNCELVSRANLCLVSVFPDIVKDCPRMRNFPKIINTQSCKQDNGKQVARSYSK